MTANELRIGNWVKDSREDYPCKVLAIDSEHLFTTKGGEVYVGTATCSQKNMLDGSRGRWLKFLEPIPLTEELLLKCGFWGSGVCEFEGIQCHFVSTAVTTKLMIVVKNHKLHLCKIEQSRVVLLSTVEYLHQLQNLLFALTGEELKIKL